ncbi:MAG: ACT domain-containing protein [Clostridium sp.]|nr:ACT domain-containing protein [Clostridium sp.]
MKAILTVIGKDKVGIIAGISNTLSQFKINILDVNQTILDGYFTMIMILDLKNCVKEFVNIQSTLAKEASALGVEVKIQREEIFKCMHTL